MVIQNTPTKIDKIASLRIGQRGENLATDIKMDVSDWITVHPDASYYCLFKRPDEVQVQPVLSSLEEDVLTWTVRAWECAVIGVGYLEVRAVNPDTGLVAKSRVIPCAIEDSVIDDEGPVPPEMSWVGEVLAAKDTAVAAKTAAEEARDTAQTTVNGAIAGIQAEGQTQVGVVQAEGTTQVGAVQSEGTTQVGAVQAKGTEVLNSIPSDYTELSDDVTGLKSAITQQTTNENTDYNNIIDWNNIKNETLMWDAGTYRDNEGYWSTGYIPIKPNTQYIKYNPARNTYPGVQRLHFFDANKNSVSGNGWDNNRVTTPANASYMVISKRYVHNGSNGTYTGIEGWDDDIGEMVINQTDNGNFHEPYPYYLNDSIHVRHSVNSTAKVHSIKNAIKDDSPRLMINRSLFAANEEISIKICGRNIFDGVTQDGYWNGASVVTNSTHKASVNPIYVNGGSYITTSANCRVTEFKSDGTYNTSAMAISRTPYLISANTDYFHISSEIANMENMCVYIGTKAPDINQTYKETVITHTVRDWGFTVYGIEIPLYDGDNTVYVKRNNAPSLTLQYNANIKTLNSEFVNVQKSVDSICDFSGIKMAESSKYTAHRGSTLQAPENTTYAIVQAFKNGFKNVEIDVRMTSDGVPVLLHDSTIDRTSNGTGAVSSMTLATLQTYDFGSWFSSKFANARIPTLDQACRLCRALNIKPHLDIAGSNVSESMANAICDILKRYELLDGAVFYVNGSNSGAPYFRAYYENTGAKYYMYYQVAGFGDSSIITLLNNINQTFRNYDMIYDMGISANITDMTSAVKEAAIGFTRRVPIAVYFVDSYEDYQSVQDYPYALYCTNRGDIPNFAAQYFAPRSIWT